MASSQDFLTTQEFAKKAGVSTSTVSKWIRTDKIKGQKKSGKWIIPASELSKVGSSATKKTAPAKKAASTPKAPKPSGKSLSIADFSKMTFLTEYGVTKWLKEGKLIGTTDSSGQTMVDSSSLEQPHVKRLLR